ncbi:DUF1330 domain-containing protein [uncultured Amphritea sp.]|uniref:DUF1330 domain-containing protein n=1 Tax=uncultured Amphritea sp. TaxID=981605 RepID=UPI00261FBEEE|nr:DUF1330 domain-containing protein [uncultured Amphritea sp.]
MKKAYNIVNILRIRDHEKFNEYVAGHIPTIEKFGGKFLVKGDSGEILEGCWESNLMVVHEFPSIEQFKEWYNSEEYRPWKELRQSCADVNVILTEGE